MSPLDSNDRPRGVAVYKPKADIYTALLGVSLFALLIAILLLALEWGRYDYAVKATHNNRAGIHHAGSTGTLSSTLEVSTNLRA